MVVFFTLLTDVSMITFNRSAAMRVIEDAARMRSMGILRSDDEASSYTARHFISENGEPYVNCTASTLDGVVEVSVEVPLSQMDMFGIIASLTGGASLTVSTYSYLEDFEA